MGNLHRCAQSTCFCGRKEGELCGRIDCPWPLAPYTEADVTTEEQTLPEFLWEPDKREEGQAND